MTDEQRQRAAQAEWLRRAAEVAETLTDDEILQLGQRLRGPTAEWLRTVARHHAEGDWGGDSTHLVPANWVMRLLLEQREFTLQSVRLGPREVGGDDITE